jgi:hypothetical protein
MSTSLNLLLAMPPVYALDRFYLLLTFLVTVAYQLGGFAIAWTFQFDKITDFTGGSNFFLLGLPSRSCPRFHLNPSLALLTLLLGQEFHTRNVVTSILVMLWAARIAGTQGTIPFDLRDHLLVQGFYCIGS